MVWVKRRSKPGFKAYDDGGYLQGKKDFAVGMMMMVVMGDRDW